MIVSPQSSATASGTALLAALSNITTASSTDPWLVHIEPGIYDLGAQTLVMKPYVDIEGSGQDVTTITTTGGPAPNNASFAIAVLYAQHAELRELTVVDTNNGQSFPSVAGVEGALPSTGPGTFRMSDVTVDVPGSSTPAGTFYGFIGAGTLRRCTVDVAAGNTYGLWDNAAPAHAIEVFDSRIIATGSVPGSVGFYNGGSAQLVNTELVGPAGATGGSTLSCVSCYNGSFAPLSASCQ